MKIFSFSGWSKSGKTTLISKLIGILKDHGNSVLAIKHAPHHIHLQPESKDTYKFMESGSETVILVGQKEMMLSKKISHQDDVFDFLDQYHEKPDYVLMEGLYREGVPVIGVMDSVSHSQSRHPVNKLSAVVCEEETELDVPRFHPDDIRQLADFMENYHE